MIAIGSGSNEGNLYFVQDLSAVTDVESGPRFKVNKLITFALSCS